MRAESRIENETAAPASFNIKNFLWEALLGLELLGEAYWGYMSDLEKAKYFLQQFKLSKIL